MAVRGRMSPVAEIPDQVAWLPYELKRVDDTVRAGEASGNASQARHSDGAVMRKVGKPVSISESRLLRDTIRCTIVSDGDWFRSDRLL